ncbi:hypothetical protein BY996DRAFT_6429485 [Phakopsora pachyrhizi]|uniref:BSD domain-containing protein n=1 Tax=Phakopsora pachyrhizi TaxID=170000 RepID=A0AAV0B054_PHAPC|nr:hypothetical protein BY996DRAFT_6429485 [Phakopsora pachyrhizi]CAH7675430.1 hypothetical protein PPACK8108_LOCUS10443 [Phakopsora pachyrhizi]
MDVPSMHDHQPSPTGTSTTTTTIAENQTDDRSKALKIEPNVADDQPEVDDRSDFSSKQQQHISQPSTPVQEGGGNPVDQSKSDNENAIPSSTTTDHPSLEQEINDLKKTLGGVGASIGGWWGKVQKQSVEAISTSNITAQISTARKDLASLNLIEKAKKEVERLSEQAKEGYSAVSTELEKGPDQASDQDLIINVDGVPVQIRKSVDEHQDQQKTLKVESESDSPAKGKQTELFDQQKSQEKKEEQASLSSSNHKQSLSTGGLVSFFSKLSKDSEKITTSLQSTLSQIPNPTKVTSSGGRFDLSGVQKAAESYLAKGEGYLQEVGKELREIVQEAVKVIPPEEPQPDDRNERKASLEDQPQDAGQSGGRRLLSGKRENMIFKLRTDESQILKDPEADQKDVFDHFLNLVNEAGGIDSTAWKKRAEDEVGLESADSLALKATFDKLVPSQMTSQKFWIRYFFAMYQIDQEEAARRAVLSAAQEEIEGDFSWDLEDESEPSSPVVVKGSNKRSSKIEEDSRSMTPTLTNKEGRLEDDQVTTTIKDFKESGKSTSKIEEHQESTLDHKQRKQSKGSFSNNKRSGAGLAGNNGGRDSSEGEGTADSFDVVSAQQSADESTKALVNEKVKKVEKPVEEEDDDDSDWE